MSDFIISAIESAGYLGIFFLMFAENIFPPIPSEVIMPFAGFSAAQGDLDPILVILAGSAGTLLGALPWWYLGRYMSGERLKTLTNRYGVYLSISTEDLERATAFFAKYQRMAVFFGRLVPGIRTVISVPAGSVGMHFGLFLALTAAGTVVWNAALLSLGYVLEDQYERVGAYLDPVTIGILGVLIGTYLYRILIQTLGRRRTARTQLEDRQER